MDSISDSINGTQNGLSGDAKDSIDRVTSDIIGKSSPGRGRPKGSPAWNKGLKKGVAPSEAKPADKPPEPITEAQLEFVRESVAQALQVTSNYRTNSVASSILAISQHLEPESKRFADGVLIPQAEIELVSGAAKAIAINHPILVTYAPYAIIVGWLGSYFMRNMAIEKEIKLLRLAVEKLGRGLEVPNASTSQAG